MGRWSASAPAQSRMSLTSLKDQILDPYQLSSSTTASATLIATSWLSIDLCCIDVRAGRHAAKVKGNAGRSKKSPRPNRMGA
jgi:hypothetical protein